MALAEAWSRIDGGGPGILYPPVNGTSNWIIVSFVVSSIGVTLLSAAFVLLVLTAVRFREWRQVYKNQLLVQFMLARILYTLLRYAADIRHIFELCDINCVIVLDAFFFLYAEVALVAWMFVFSKQMHDSLVKVFNVEKYNIWKTSLLTWFLPGIVTLLLNLAFYFQDDKDILYYLIYLFLVKWPLLTINAVLLISILKSVRNSNQNTENNLRITIVMVVLIFMFSFQQLMVDAYKLVYIVILNNYVNYIMTIGNILALYHCAFSIIFWLFGNANTRKLWSNNKVRPQSQIINRNSMV